MYAPMKIPFLYQVNEEKNVDVKQDGIRLISMDRLLASLV
jgi:hypothetical protein